jgi:replicative DNA helicase
VDDEEAMPELIGDFGAVKELNKYAGGITTKTMYSVLAPTKAGKSKFTTRMLHNVMVEHGHPVVCWPFEGGAADWFAQLRSIHFDYLYNKDAEPSKQILGVSQQMIREKKWKSEEIRQLEEASRVDLFTNPKYGKVIVIDRPFKVETIESELDTAVNTYGAKAVLIDYLQLIGWEDARMSKVQAIGRAYQTVLRYTRTRGVAAISPAQCTQEFINECAKSKDGAVKELRTAGAESSEVVRTPDVNIALYSSTDDLINNSMKIMSIPSRYMSAFPAFEIYCDLSRSLFASLD